MTDRSSAPGLSRVLSAVLFALFGVAFLAWWVVADPSHEISDTQDEWPYVLAFSGVILVLGIAVPLYARLVGDALVRRVSLVVAGGAFLGSVANVFEDGLGIEGVFFIFVFSLLLMNVGLIALVILLARRGRGGRRLLALVPAGTLLAIIFAVEVGGPLMLVTWLGAGVVVLAVPDSPVFPSERLPPGGETPVTTMWRDAR